MTELWTLKTPIALYLQFLPYIFFVEVVLTEMKFGIQNILKVQSSIFRQSYVSWTKKNFNYLVLAVLQDRKIINEAHGGVQG